MDVEGERTSAETDKVVPTSPCSTPVEGVAARRLPIEASRLTCHCCPSRTVAQPHVAKVAKGVDTLARSEKTVELGVPRVVGDLDTRRSAGLRRWLRRLLGLWRRRSIFSQEISDWHRLLWLLLEHLLLWLLLRRLLLLLLGL